MTNTDPSRSVRRLAIISCLALGAACTGPQGQAGQDGQACSVTVLDGGSARILCADGTSAVIPAGPNGTNGVDGQQGPQGDAGTSCSVVDNGNGTKTITCSDGTTVTVSNGTNGTNGANGTNGTNGLGVNVTAFHGTDYLANQALTTTGKFPAAITITSATADSTGLVTVNFNVTRALGDGGVAAVTTIPAPKFTVAKLVPPVIGEASNHWVPYITHTATVPATATGYTNPPGTVVTQAYRENNGALTNLGDGGYSYVYSTKLAAAAFPDGGLVGYDPTLTHRVAILMGGSAGATGSNAFDFVPNGSPVTETRDIVQTAICKQCHGPNFSAHSGDRTEVQVCVTCHNATSVDAYSNNNVEFKQLIHNIHAGGEKASVAGADGILWDDPTTAIDESADNKPFTIGPTPQDWWKLEFPSKLANCTKCHQGTGANVDNWKTKPSRAACLSCHDMTDVVSANTAHPGGPQTNDAFCGGCHTSSGAETTNLKPTPVMHDWTLHDPRIQPEFTSTITMTPPQNGQYYVKGEAPTVTVALTDVETNSLIDHTTMLADTAAEGCPGDGGACPPRDGLFMKANFLVHGPRGLNTAVLTRAARSAVVAPTAGPYDLSADGGTLVVKFDQGYNQHLVNKFGDYTINALVTVATKVTDGGVMFANPAAATADETIAWLNGNAGFAARGVAYYDEKTGRMAIRSRNLGPVYAVQLQPSAVTTSVFANDQTIHVPGGSTPTNPLAKLADGGVNDPRVTYAAGSVSYQLDPVDDLVPGTYTVGLEIADRGNGGGTSYKVPSVGFLNFQVGTATEEKPIARNCNTCHQNATGQGMIYDPSGHGKILRDKATDQCGGCHDYQPQNPTGATWSGAVPISRRLHAVHNGKNLTYPITTVGHADEYAARAWQIQYPQDIRTCETCHVKGQTSGTWITNANRVACGGCHDSDDATAHIKIMTYDPTPLDAYSGDEVQSCTVCH